MYFFAAFFNPSVFTLNIEQTIINFDGSQRDESELTYLTLQILNADPILIKL